MKFVISCMHACMKLLSHIQLFAIPWTVGSSIHGIFQARILEWVAISFSINCVYELNYCKSKFTILIANILI